MYICNISSHGIVKTLGIFLGSSSWWHPWKNRCQGRWLLCSAGSCQKCRPGWLRSAMVETPLLSWEQPYQPWKKFTRDEPPHELREWTLIEHLYPSTVSTRAFLEKPIKTLADRNWAGLALLGAHGTMCSTGRSLTVASRFFFHTLCYQLLTPHQLPRDKQKKLRFILMHRDWANKHIITAVYIIQIIYIKQRCKWLHVHVAHRSILNMLHI